MKHAGLGRGRFSRWRNLVPKDLLLGLFAFAFEAGLFDFEASAAVVGEQRLVSLVWSWTAGLEPPQPVARMGELFTSIQLIRQPYAAVRAWSS